MEAKQRLLIVGNVGGTNVGGSFLRAARRMGLPVRVVEIRHAFAGPRLWRALHWRLLGHRPPGLGRFGPMVRAASADFEPTVLLATGLAPLVAETLDAVQSAGVRTLNYLTDDPWNPAQRSSWFLQALPHYDVVFSPRRANLDDLRQAGCPRVEYLPFAYDPRFARPVEPRARDGGPEILFVGGADKDRVQVLGRVIAAGFRVALYGDYWERYAATRAAACGHAGPRAVCRATAAARVALCLVRRANRDGHVMRTFEIAAIGACMLAEDTPEHRDILGDAAVYFADVEQLIDRARELLADSPRRARLATALRQRVVAGPHTYRDRLATMLRVAASPCVAPGTGEDRWGLAGCKA